MSDQKIIIIRKGINGFSFAICNSEGNWIGNANSIEEIRKEYQYELKHGIIKIKKETTILPTDAQMFKSVKYSGLQKQYCLVN